MEYQFTVLTETEKVLTNFVTEANLIMDSSDGNRHTKKLCFLQNEQIYTSKPRIISVNYIIKWYMENN
jgi:hypothetical protein